MLSHLTRSEIAPLVRLSFTLACYLCVAPTTAAIIWDGTGDPTAAGLVFHNSGSSFKLDHDHEGPQPGVLHQEHPGFTRPRWLGKP